MVSTGEGQHSGAKPEKPSEEACIRELQRLLLEPVMLSPNQPFNQQQAGERSRQAQAALLPRQEVTPSSRGYASMPASPRQRTLVPINGRVPKVYCSGKSSCSTSVSAPHPPQTLFVCFVIRASHLEKVLATACHA